MGRSRSPPSHGVDAVTKRYQVSVSGGTYELLRVDLERAGGCRRIKPGQLSGRADEIINDALDKEGWPRSDGES